MQRHSGKNQGPLQFLVNVPQNFMKQYNKNMLVSLPFFWNYDYAADEKTLYVKDF